MTNIYEKARELAEELLESELGKKYTDAKFVFENNAEAVEKMNEYNAFRTDAIEKMKADRMTAEEIDDARAKMNEMATELRTNEIINEMVVAENRFNYFVQNVMGVFNATLTGNLDEGNGGCSGSCSSCGGCR